MALSMLRAGHHALFCAVLGLAAALAGCGGGDEVHTEPALPPQGSPVAGELVGTPTGTALGTFVYDLDNGATITAVSGAETDSMILYLPGEVLTLGRVESASGARYVGGGVVFWNKGTEVTFEGRDGVKVNGRENRRRSIIEDSRRRGNTFYGTGNEPGWTLEIGPETTVLVTDYGNWRFVFPTPAAQVDAVLGRTFYKTYTDAVDIIIELRDEPCADSMSGENFPATVMIRLGRQNLQGCGVPLN